MEIEKSEEVTKLLESRGIREEDLISVIQDAESGGEKFYHPESKRYIAKKRLSEATYYVVYTIEDGKYVISSAFWHKSALR
jgi:hypothetical protein